MEITFVSISTCRTRASPAVANFVNTASLYSLWLGVFLYESKPLFDLFIHNGNDEGAWALFFLFLVILSPLFLVSLWALREEKT
jgi:hypothetical protein